MFKIKSGQNHEKLIGQKEFQVLNLTAVPYEKTNEHTKFLNSAEKEIRKVLDQTNVDDLCGSMFDCFIASKFNEMKASAREQYIEHTSVIYHHKGLLKGSLEKANGHLENLQHDLEELEEKLNNFRQCTDALENK